MPEPKQSIDINKAVPRRERPRVSDHIDPNKPVPHVVTLDVSWGVTDLETNQTTVFQAEGGQFKSVPGHRYLIYFRAMDVKGVQKMTLDGSGMFQVATDVDRNGIYHEAVLPMPASIPHAEFVNTGIAPTLQVLIAVMKPDIGAFDYFRLSAGFHHLNGTSESLEYFAFSGVMTFFASAIDARGDRLTASLTTAP